MPGYWLELIWEQEAPGSNPGIPTNLQVARDAGDDRPGHRRDPTTIALFCNLAARAAAVVELCQANGIGRLRILDAEPHAGRGTVLLCRKSIGF